MFSAWKLSRVYSLSPEPTQDTVKCHPAVPGWHGKWPLCQCLRDSLYTSDWLCTRWDEIWDVVDCVSSGMQGVPYRRPASREPRCWRSRRLAIDVLTKPAKSPIKRCELGHRHCHSYFMLLFGYLRRHLTCRSSWYSILQRCVTWQIQQQQSVSDTVTTRVVIAVRCRNRRLSWWRPFSSASVRASPVLSANQSETCSSRISPLSKLFNSPGLSVVTSLYLC